MILGIPVIVAIKTSWQPNGTLLRAVENELPLFQKATPTSLRRFGAHILYLGSLVEVAVRYRVSVVGQYRFAEF